MSVYRIHSDRHAADLVRTLRRQLSIALIVLLGTIVISTVGFVLFDDDAEPMSRKIFYAFWDTLNLVSTVGSLPELDTMERAWALGVIIFGLGAVIYGFGSLQELLHGGEVYSLIQRRKMRKAIDQLSDHIIVCGYGDVGAGVTHHLRELSGGAPIVVIDIDPERAARADDEGFIAIEADCASEETLTAAGLSKARGLIAALSKDADNVYLCVIARQMRSDIRIVTRAERSGAGDILRKAGADRVIVPGELASLQLTYLMLKPKVSEFVAAATTQGEYEFVEVSLSDFPSLVGRTLRQIDFPRAADALVITIITAAGEELFNPSPDKQLRAGDTLIVVCKGGGLERIEKLGQVVD